MGIKEHNISCSFSFLFVYRFGFVFIFNSCLKLVWRRATWQLCFALSKVFGSVDSLFNLFSIILSRFFLIIVGWLELLLMYLIEEFSFLYGIKQLLARSMVMSKKLHLFIPISIVIAETDVFKDLYRLLFYILKILAVFVFDDY